MHYDLEPKVPGVPMEGTDKEDQGTDNRTALQRTIRKQEVCVRAGLDWLRTETTDWFF
jgi:hypothetical protein